jgi:hypothetical protein
VSSGRLAGGLPATNAIRIEARMKLTDVDQYVALRASLTKEKAALEVRLAAINRALGNTTAGPTAAKAGPKSSTVSAPKAAKRPKRAKNEMTMKEATVKALTGTSLGRQDVLKAVLALGYKFTASDPLNSLSSLLYADKTFKNKDGKFSLAK